MNNLTDLLKDVGIEIPEEKKADFEKKFNENYKTIAEFTKKTEALEKRATLAEDGLKKFEGIDLEAGKAELAKVKAELEEERNKYKADLEKRAFDTALENELSKIKFSSEYAKEAFKREVVGLPVKDGKIYGITDKVNELKETHKDMFFDEEQKDLEDKRAKFTKSVDKGGMSTDVKTELAKIKDPEARRNYIKAHAKEFGLQ